MHVFKVLAPLLHSCSSFVVSEDVGKNLLFVSEIVTSDICCEDIAWFWFWFVLEGAFEFGHQRRPLLRRGIEVELYITVGGSGDCGATYGECVGGI